MSSFKLARASLTAAAALCCSMAFAGTDTATLAVSATVTSLCKIVSVPAMSFTLDPSSTTAATATSTLTYKCTKGATAPTVTFARSGSAVTGGTLTGATTSSETMAFALSAAAAAAGQGFSTAQTLTLTGTIANAAFVGLSAQSYTSPATDVNLNF